MGSVAKTNLHTHTPVKNQPRMKLQLAVLFACFLAFGSASKLGKASADAEVQEYLKDIYKDTQAILKKEKIPVGTNKGQFDFVNYSQRLYGYIQSQTAGKNDDEFVQIATGILKNQKDWLVGEMGKVKTFSKGSLNDLNNLMEGVKAKVNAAVTDGNFGDLFKAWGVFLNL